MEELVEQCIPDFPEAEIIDIMEYLYNAKDEEVYDVANRICNIYQKNNIDFLREIYTKYKNLY
ncbi:hypothetical protein [Bacillus sp. JJ927]|uniref:hypothetical protein n=1 Tax=Bacillus sp. JJ927 TaxID=3122976 RepID=UPI0033929325